MLAVHQYQKLGYNDVSLFFRESEQSEWHRGMCKRVNAHTGGPVLQRRSKPVLQLQPGQHGRAEHPSLLQHPFPRLVSLEGKKRAGEGQKGEEAWRGPSSHLHGEGWGANSLGEMGRSLFLSQSSNFTRTNSARFFFFYFFSPS
jgi:hypothetical protein